MSFKDVEKEVLALYNEQQYEEAAQLLEKVKDKYPDDLYSITWDCAVFYLLMEPKKIDKCLDILEFGSEKGLFYSVDPNYNLWEPLKENNRFKEFLSKNNDRILKAQEEAKFEYEVKLPKNYSKDNEYPLHVAIHGAGESIEFFKPYWSSKVLDNEYITLFVQATKVVSSIGYSWFEDIELNKSEIKNAFEKVQKEYNVDVNNVTIGGFSQGGTLAIDLTLSELIPCNGFISLCPIKPDNFSGDLVKQLNEKGVKGVILTGEMDQALPQQKEMVEVFEENGFAYEFIINPKLGHWFPENISEQITEALEFLE